MQTLQTPSPLNPTTILGGGEIQFVANDSNDYKSTGKKRDTETGLDYFGARYYPNGLGRWVSADWSATPVPVPYADFGDPQSLNLYGYVHGLPTTRIDADGHDGGTAAAVWELLGSGADVSAGMWTIGSVALPGMIGGGLAYKGINSIADDNDTVANAEMQYQVGLNNLAVRINEMARAGKSTEQLRKEWEKLPGKNGRKTQILARTKMHTIKMPRQTVVPIQQKMGKACP